MRIASALASLALIAMTGAQLHATIDRECKARKGVLVDLELAKP